MKDNIGTNTTLTTDVITISIKTRNNNTPPLSTNSPQYQCTYQVWWKSIDKLSFGNENTDGRCTDGYTDDQCKTIIPCQYRVAGYKNGKWRNYGSPWRTSDMLFSTLSFTTSHFRLLTSTSDFLLTTADAPYFLLLTSTCRTSWFQFHNFWLLPYLILTADHYF